MDFLTKYKIIDLTYDLDEHTPVWPTVVPFNRDLLEDYDHEGYRCFKFSQSEGVGTHMDSPMHFSRGGRSISDLPCQDLITQACIMDIRDKVKSNPDYTLLPSDISDWENKHGLIPKNSLVIAYTGWSQYWFNREKYLNMDATGKMHFPGFSKEAAEVLVKKEIMAVGIDTLSIDSGQSEGFLAHNTFLGNNKYQIENLANLDQLPAVGAIVIALPIKIKHGAEAPIRAIAFIPK